MLYSETCLKSLSHRSKNTRGENWPLWRRTSGLKKQKRFLKNRSRLDLSSPTRTKSHGQTTWTCRWRLKQDWLSGRSNKVPWEGSGVMAPTGSRFAQHLVALIAPSKKYFHGEKIQRILCVMPPKEGLPGVPPGGLLKPNRHIYGFTDAGRASGASRRRNCVISASNPRRTNLRSSVSCAQQSKNCVKSCVARR